MGSEMCIRDRSWRCPHIPNRLHDVHHEPLDRQLQPQPSITSSTASTASPKSPQHCRHKKQSHAQTVQPRVIKLHKRVTGNVLSRLSTLPRPSRASSVPSRRSSSRPHRAEPPPNFRVIHNVTTAELFKAESSNLVHKSSTSSPTSSNPRSGRQHPPAARGTASSRVFVEPSRRRF